MLFRLILTLFFVALQLPNLIGQDNFIKKIEKDMTTLGYQIELYNDRIFILTAKVCNNISECSTVIEIDKYGNALWNKELPFLDVSSKSMITLNP